MKIFLDTADLPTIRRLWDTGLIDGVTTNQYEIWGPDADGTTFIAQAHSLLGAREVIDADLTRLASNDLGGGLWT